jgi:hypothetical protein
MKSIFTIHAGEYLVGSEIEKKFRNYCVWLPSKDTGIDLLITNRSNTRTVTLQVKFSKDFSSTHGKKDSRHNIRCTGWWTLKRDKIQNSIADFWVFVLYEFKTKNYDFLIIRPNDLLSIFSKTGRTTKSIHCYITVTNDLKAFETRGLNDRDMQMIFDKTYSDKTRNLKKYLNNWQPLLNKLK